MCLPRPVLPPISPTLRSRPGSIDITNESADDIIVRTDFDDRLKIRGRVDFSVAKWLRVLATAEYIDTSNGASGVGYTATTDHFSIGLDFDPTENLTFHLAWDDYSTDTTMPILVPQTLTQATSIHSENGTLLEGGLLWRISIVTLDVGYSEFENEGTFDFEMKRAFLRLGVDLSDHWAVSADYENNDYSEEVLDLAQYDATRDGIFLRWHR